MRSANSETTTSQSANQLLTDTVKLRPHSLLFQNTYNKHEHLETCRVVIIRSIISNNCNDQIILDDMNILKETEPKTFAFAL